MSFLQPLKSLLASARRDSVATPKKKVTVVDDVQGVEVSNDGLIAVVFDGQGNKTVNCSINGVGYTYPTDEVVRVDMHVADAIGRYRLA